MVMGEVEISKMSSIWYGTVIRGDVALIKIGEKVNIQDNCVLHSEHNLILSIGDNTTIGHGAIIHGCEIKGDAIIGMGSILLNNSIISKNVIIGAGSLVTEGKFVPEGELWMGRPAKFIRKLTTTEIENIKNSAESYYEIAIVHKGEKND
ncbi:MAG: gamma carbonic anhydrase family protein [Clostridium sp.]|nr:gamma carbonic anhydrase family protein [Clostridium sp.]